MSQPIIEIKGISKRYQLGSIGATRLRDDVERLWHRLTGKAEAVDKEEFWALRDVSFEVQPGEIVGIIGRNGAGKSTLLKILSRITEPTSGEIVLRGRVASLLEVGTGFVADLSGRDNIFLNGAILGMTKAEIRSKFDEIVAFAEIEQFIDTPVKRYSSGMYVRLAFAVAAHLEPEILIVDEVLAVGDSAFQEKCIGKMQDVSRGGRTVLFVSHNMGAAATLCTKAVLLNAGSVELGGLSQDVINHYLNSVATAVSHDIKKLRAGSMGEQVRFVSIEMAGSTDSVNYGDPIVFEFEVESERNFDRLSIGSSIFRRAGDAVGTLFATETFSISKGEKKTVRLTINADNVAPGSYYAGFSIGTGGFSSERHDYDIVIGAPTFTIAPRTESGLLASWHQNWGAIHFSDNSLEVMETVTAE